MCFSYLFQFSNVIFNQTKVSIITKFKDLVSSICHALCPEPHPCAVQVPAQVKPFQKGLGRAPRPKQHTPTFICHCLSPHPTLFSVLSLIYFLLFIFTYLSLFRFSFLSPPNKGVFVDLLTISSPKNISSIRALVSVFVLLYLQHLGWCLAQIYLLNN